MESYNTFRVSLKFVLDQEGGYSNDPQDSGGATLWGITQATYDTYLNGLHRPLEPVLKMQPDDAVGIYASMFWDKAGCDSLPLPVCTVVFDSAVQHGVNRAVQWLHQAKNVTDYLVIRKQFYLDIVRNRPDQSKFLKGWLARLGDLTKFVQINSQSDTQS